jgi:ribosome biogenesis GTPase
VVPEPTRPSNPPADGGVLLRALGWDDERDEERSALGSSATDLTAGRVAVVNRGSVDVLTAAGSVAARVRAVHPCTGDWVLVRHDDDGSAEVTHVLDRRTLVRRASAGRDSTGQDLAANVDTVGIVVPIEPEPRPSVIERYLVLAWESGAEPVVVLTKADLVPDADERAARVGAASPGAAVVVMSTSEGHRHGDALAALRGTVVLLGPSGAGKSSLGNVLLGEERLATGEVRAVDDKGRHTTVRRELHVRPGGGVLIDTPGLRAVGLVGAADGLERTYSDIEDLATRCRFGDCAHDTEPDCAVQVAIDDGILDPDRLARWRRMRREDAWATSRVEAQAERDRIGKERSRALREMYRIRGKR